MVYFFGTSFFMVSARTENRKRKMANMTTQTKVSFVKIIIVIIFQIQEMKFPLGVQKKFSCYRWHHPGKVGVYQQIFLRKLPSAGPMGFLPPISEDLASLLCFLDHNQSLKIFIKN